MSKNKAKKKKLQLVYIEWCDASSDRGAWLRLADCFEWVDGADHTVHECGFILREDDKFLVMAMRWIKADEFQTDRFGQILKIPKPWIKKRKIIKEFDCEALNQKNGDKL